MSNDYVAVGTGIFIASIILIMANGAGWIMNIFKLISCDWVLSGEEVLRIVGIFVVPLGGILGWIGHF
jgi:hypothetical protein